MVTCDYCGEEFGNEGGLETHKRFCDQAPDSNGGGNQDTAGTSPPPNDGSGTAAEVPDRREREQTQEIQAQSEGAVGAGMQFGKLIASMSSGSPEEKATAQGETMKGIGAVIASVGEQKMKEKVAGAERSKNMNQDDLRVSDEYVNCPECSGQVTNVPPTGEEFQCPHCGIVLLSP